MSNIYLIFGYEQYYPNGGFNDLLARGASLEAVKEAYIQYQLENLFTYGHIIRREDERIEVLDCATAGDVTDALPKREDHLLDEWRNEARVRWEAEGNPRRDTAKYNSSNSQSEMASEVAQTYTALWFEKVANLGKRFPSLEAEGRIIRWRKLQDNLEKNQQ